MITFSYCINQMTHSRGHIQIYNFVVDPRREIVVNGILINSPAPPGAKRVERTYVSTLGIVAHRLRKKIMVTNSIHNRFLGTT